MIRRNFAAPLVGLFALLVVCASSTANLAHAQQQHRCGCWMCRASALANLAPAQEEELEGFYLGSDEDEVAAFRTQGVGWTSTSSGSSGLGQPATVTWSVVPDNTQLPTGLQEPVSNSNLIAFLDGIHEDGNSPGGADLTQRSWWGLINSAFERWDELSGIDFSYEPNDDGTKLGTSGSSGRGVLGTRGDHRIGGHSIDGQTSPTFLAYNFFPNNSDTVIDTDEINRWGNELNNYRLFRNMLMHEIGHGIGLNHVESEDIFPELSGHQFGTFLMEPILSGRFDGPQFDDILGAHRLYGDIHEENGGNDTYQSATMLGNLLSGQTLSIGTDAEDTFVDFDDVDFVSIDDESDTDFFKFTIADPHAVDIKLTPMGPTYAEGRQGSGNGGTQQPFVSSAKNNLTLTLYGPGGLTELLEFSNSKPAGQAEWIRNHSLSTPGEYFVRVAGITFNQAQFFQLDVTAVPEPTSLVLLVLGGVCCVFRGRRRL